MRTRAYRPEAPNSLEDRSLLSGVARPLVNPVVISAAEFGGITRQMRVDFQMYARNGDNELLQTQLLQVAVRVPFGGVNGLGISINSILRNMEQDISGGVPRAIRTATNEVIAATHANLAASIRDGLVIVRR